MQIAHLRHRVGLKKQWNVKDDHVAGGCLHHGVPCSAHQGVNNTLQCLDRRWVAQDQRPQGSAIDACVVRSVCSASVGLQHTSIGADGRWKGCKDWMHRSASWLVHAVHGGVCIENGDMLFAKHGGDGRLAHACVCIVQ